VQGIGVRVISDHRQGYAWAGSLDPAVVDETLAEARDNARFGEPDEHFGLASPSEFGWAAPDLDLWRAALESVATEEKVRLALEAEAATKSADRRIRGVESAGYGDAMSEHAIANSLGIEAYTRRTVCSVYAYALADDGSGTQTGYGFTAGRSLDELDLDCVPRDAVERACRLLGAKQVAGRRLPVVFDPLVTRSVLGVLSAAFDGEAVLKGRALFAGREGEPVAAAHVHVVDDPTDPRAFGAATHDSEGVPTRCTALIAGGVLQGFLHNVYTARRAGATTTGSAVRGFTSTPGVGVRALRLEPGAKTPEEVLAAVPEALYVQSVSGLHSGTNPISGDFSVGAEGLMVRGGALAEPVREVTIASTLQRILLDIDEIGNDLTFLPGSTAGMTVLVSEMTMSGS
jgi:PmbA protein